MSAQLSFMRLYKNNFCNLHSCLQKQKLPLYLSPVQKKSPFTSPVQKKSPLTSPVQKKSPFTSTVQKKSPLPHQYKKNRLFTHQYNFNLVNSFADFCWKSDKIYKITAPYSKIDCSRTRPATLDLFLNLQKPGSSINITLQCLIQIWGRDVYYYFLLVTIN